MFPAPSQIGKPRSFDARRHRLWGAAVALTVAGFCAASAVMLLDMRHDTLDRARTGELNLVNALSQDIARNVELYDLSLKAVVDGLAEPGFNELTPRVQDLILYDRAATASDLGAMLVLDRTGKVVRGSQPGFVGTDLSDREYFRALRADPRQGLLISKPFRRRVTGSDDVIALARALHGPDGTFSGVAVGTLRLAYLNGLFAKADLGPRGAINLFLPDGTRITRAPYDQSSIGRSLAGTDNFKRLSSGRSGAFVASSAVDGVRRMYAYTRVGDLPLILDVALSESDVLAPWLMKAFVIGLALLVLCAVAAVLARAKARSEAEHRLMAENAIDVVIRFDRAFRRTYVSPSARTVLGYDPAELIACSPEDVVHAEDWSTAVSWIDAARDGVTNAEAVFQLRRSDGTYAWVEGRCRALPDGSGFLTVLRDIGERKAAEARTAALTAELASLANSDGLTGLANRRRFDEVLAREESCATADGRPLSLLLLDVDRFKAFNDRYGHQDGDACLRQVANALREAVTVPDALVARYGGEEFAVILPRVDAGVAAAEAERVRFSVERLCLTHTGNRQGVVTVSIGCATADVQGSLVATADARLYEAKRTGRNRVVAADPKLDETIDSSGDLGCAEAVDRYVAVGAFESSESLDQMAGLAAHLFGTPAAFISLVGTETVRLVGRHGVTDRSAGRREAFCSQTIQGEDPLVVLDAASEGRFADLPLVRDGVRFYAGAPITDAASGQTLGALCIVDTVAREHMDRGQRDVLVGLAHLASRDIAKRLATAGREGDAEVGATAHLLSSPQDERGADEAMSLSG